jgi:plastocyanin
MKSIRDFWRKMKQKSLLIVSAIVLTLVLAACSANPTTTPVQQPVNNSPTQLPATSIPSSSGTTVDVAIANFSFSPDTLTIKVGTTVTWTNQDSVEHTVTSDTGLFDSGNLSQGKTFNYTFTEAGTYPYHCTPHHSKMAGTVIVTN